MILQSKVLTTKEEIERANGVPLLQLKFLRLLDQILPSTTQAESVEIIVRVDIRDKEIVDNASQSQ